MHSLLKERLGLELTRPELVRVQEATAGNPFFALELGRELVRTGTRPTAGRALRVPESLRELLGERLARLPGETLDVLLQVAALARPTVELVAARTETGIASSERWRRLNGKGSSSSTTRASASRTLCSPRSATRRHRSGSAARFTRRWPGPYRT